MAPVDAQGDAPAKAKQSQAQGQRKPDPPMQFKIIANPDGSAPLDCQKQQGVFEYVTQQVKDAGNSLSWELSSRLHDARANWLSCAADGQRKYIKDLETNYNLAAEGFNRLVAAATPDQVNARIEKLQKLYETCDSAVPAPTNPEAVEVCSKEDAVWRCAQAVAKKYMDEEEARPEGAWGHVFRAVTSGMYSRKLNYQACQLNEATKAIDWCTKNVRSQPAPKGEAAPREHRVLPLPIKGTLR